MSNHRALLDAYLVDVPAFRTTNLDTPGIDSGTPIVPAPTPDTIKKNKPYTTNPLFKKYTDWEHESLLNKWLSDKTTTCNEFVKGCGYAMGANENLGRFDIQDHLKRSGKLSCWRAYKGDNRPNYGDIFLQSNWKENILHMAVSLNLEGDQWNTVESGQRGPRAGFDLLQRKRAQWTGKNLIGWIDMEAYLKIKEPPPIWLKGWWTIDDGVFVSYYYFAPGNEVFFTMNAPTDANAIPAGLSDKGSYVVQDRGAKLVIHWPHSADADETFRHFPPARGQTETMDGLSKWGPFKAVKL